MRLIDADAFNDWILSHFAEPQSALILTLQGFIAEQPTAYSAGKVVEELEELADKSYKAYCIDFYSGDRAKYDAYTNAIKIVKHGGVADYVCEWKIFDNSLTEEPQWVYETTCGRYIGEEHTSKSFVYCPYCSKKIKVVE